MWCNTNANSSNLGQIIRTTYASIYCWFKKFYLICSRIVEDLHKRKVVHRDLKLGNIVLNLRSRKVTLTNFCLGKHLMNERDLLKVIFSYSGDLNTRLAWYLNSTKSSSCRMSGFPMASESQKSMIFKCHLRDAMAQMAEQRPLTRRTWARALPGSYEIAIAHPRAT